MTQYVPEFIEKNRIAQPINAFYVFSKLYSDVADFRHPNIAEKGKVESLTIRDIALYLLGDNNNIRYSDFPETKYEWNSFLIESIVKKYLTEYKIIELEYKDRRYQKGILVNANSSITSYPELVASVFKDAGYSEMTKGQFLAFLVVHGLARQVVLRELPCSPYFSLEKEVYRLKTERG